MRSIFSFAAAFILVCTALTNRAVGQVIINEVMVDPTGSDGTPPNSSEWIELYNPTGADIDISCMLISDGDVVLTIPSPTTIPAGGTFTIGSSVGLTSPDLNWASCGCSSNTPLTMSFDNTAEQIFLYGNLGQLTDGVTWGGGSFGPGSSGTGIISSVAVGACTSTFNLDFSVNPNDPNISPINVIEGQSNALDCTNTNFLNDPNPNPGETNNAQVPVAVIDSPTTSVCSDTPVDFSAAGSLGVTNISWTGATVAGTVAGLAYTNAEFAMPATGNTVSLMLTVENGCGATDTEEILIEVVEASDPVITAPVNPNSNGIFQLCSDLNTPPILTVNALPGSSIQWLLNSAPIPSATSATYIPTNDGIYSVNVTSATGVCNETSDQIDVELLPTPVASFVNPDTTACVNDPSIVLEAAPGFTDYSWTIDGVSSGTVASSITIPTIAVGSITVELIVTQGICVSDPLVITPEVFAYPVVEIDPAGPLDLCPDDQVILSSVNTHNSYQWLLNGAAIAGEIGQTLNYVYSQPASASITLQAEDNGCTAETAVPVDIVEHDFATIASWTPPPYAENNTLFTCQDEHPILAVSNGLQFQWYYNGVAIPGEIGLTITATQDGEYYYTASIDGFCEIYSDTITVDLEMSLDIETFASKDTACVGDSVLIIPDGDFVSYSWNGGIVGDTLTVTNTGIYIVTAHLVSCDTTDTVSVYFSPYPVMNAGDDFYSDCEDNTLLYGTTTGDSTFWELDNILLTYGDTVVIPTPTRTSDLVMVSYLNECEARDTVNIKVDCVYIFAPTAITPDGDGLNDVFRVYANGLTQYTLRIFNRYGQVVFETSDPEDVWTGGYNDYYLPNGVYTWQIEALDYNQQEALSKARSKGSIFVVR
ncbi:MAG: gliding motility-associated C-terminal domain-containing protein [Flavobacteriales bacterium]